MEQAWCFLCRIERSGADPRTAWGLNAWEDERDPQDRRGPMSIGQASYLRSLCEGSEETFDPSLIDGEWAIVVDSFLDEPMTDSQARTKIRSLVAIRGLKSA
jgi:hypothetical protein